MDPRPPRRDDEDYALLRRLRSRRREPHPDTMAFVERLQAGVCTRQPKPMTTADFIRAMPAGATGAQIAEMTRYFEEIESSIRPPTPYESAGHHKKVQLCAAELDEAAARLGRRRGAADPPVFALMEFGHVNARTIRAPHTGDSIVLVDTELLQFLFLFSKAVALAVPTGSPAPDGWLTYATRIDDVRAHLRSDGRALARFSDVVLSYAMTGRASHAEAYRVPLGTERLYGIIMRAAQTFVLAHEYAHVLLGHLSDGRRDASGADGERVAQSLWSLALEGHADRVGLNLTLDVMRRQGYDHNFTYWGVELFFHANEIATEAISLLRSGHEWRGLSDGERHQRASVNARRTILKALFAAEMKQAVGDEAAFERVWNETETGLDVVHEIVRALWTATVPMLKKAHAAGARPSSAWDG
ncbi:hypothetical protein AB0I22_25955 [Streptomyces sp. NPDC050610]|uniref:hypothetical protein n=1 Tax=Streptomyces sp. NPDC050610 TaxID=3157097 RepID=UPI003430F4CF